MAVTRTSLVDAGLGTALFAVFPKEDKDRHVVHAALADDCNLVNKLSTNLISRTGHRLASLMPPELAQC